VPGLSVVLDVRSTLWMYDLMDVDMSRRGGILLYGGVGIDILGTNDKLFLK
jgi:hypothetical protein